MIKNTSGHGKFARLPYQLDHWNWGAFLLPIPWGLAHGVYISLLFLIPIVGLVVPFYLGAKGNQKAWEARYWESEEKFASRQRKWAIAGVVVTIIVLMIYLIPNYMAEKEEDKIFEVYEEMQNLILENDQVKAELGQELQFFYSRYIASSIKNSDLNNQSIEFMVTSDRYNDPYSILAHFTRDDSGHLKLDHVEIKKVNGSD